MSISDKIQRLRTAKSNIAAAITAKGGAVGENDGFEEFSSDISSIPDGVQTAYNYTTSGSKLIHADFEVTSGEVVANIPDGVITIGNTAFMDDNFITSVIMSDSVTSIEDGSYDYPGSSSNRGAFFDCLNLRNISFSSNLTSIGKSAFYGCKALTTLTLGNSVTSIGNGAFGRCDALTTLTLGNSVTSIGNDAFKNCNALTSLTIPDSVTSIGNSAFEYCYALTALTIGNSVTSIGDYTFSDCWALTSLTIGNSVTSIGNRAFENCSALTTLTLGNSVTTIGNNAFYKCNALTSLTIPDSVTSIGDSAFYACLALTTVDMTAFDGTTVPTLANSNAFYAKTHATRFMFVFATQEARNAFASAPNWSSFSQYFRVA